MKKSKFAVKRETIFVEKLFVTVGSNIRAYVS